MFSSQKIKTSRHNIEDVRRPGVTQTFSFQLRCAFLFVFKYYISKTLHKTESRFRDISKLKFHKSANGKYTWGVCHDSFPIS